MLLKEKCDQFLRKIIFENLRLDGVKIKIDMKKFREIFKGVL